jgi:hypothetical protein
MEAVITYTHYAAELELLHEVVYHSLAVAAQLFAYFSLRYVSNGTKKERGDNTRLDDVFIFITLNVQVNDCPIFVGVLLIKVAFDFRRKQSPAPTPEVLAHVLAASTFQRSLGLSIPISQSLR